jgi:hypothetical protein
MENNYKMVAKTFGFEEILKKKCWALKRGAGVRMVSFKAIKGLCTKQICRYAPH